MFRVQFNTEIQKVFPHLRILTNNCFMGKCRWALTSQTTTMDYSLCLQNTGSLLVSLVTRVNVKRPLQGWNVNYSMMSRLQWIILGVNILSHDAGRLCLYGVDLASVPPLPPSGLIYLPLPAVGCKCAPPTWMCLIRLTILDSTEQEEWTSRRPPGETGASTSPLSVGSPAY